uniref:Ig-like domain-containing protein n=1 Tax=Xiphophorus maculatus TaxID=8083 RepID=A0A3B5Q0Q3_XIPMA
MNLQIDGSDLVVPNYVTIKATVGENVILPCEDPDQEEIIVVEWSRTDLGPESVLLYRDSQFDPINQDPSYRNRVDLLVRQIKKGDASLILQNTTTDDSGTYECYVVKTTEMKLICSVSLVVAPPPPPGECLSLDQNQQLPGSFPVRVGLRQGCPLSPILLINFMDRISRPAKVLRGSVLVALGSHLCFLRMMWSYWLHQDVICSSRWSGV